MVKHKYFIVVIVVLIIAALVFVTLPLFITNPEGRPVEPAARITSNVDPRSGVLPLGNGHFTYDGAKKGDVFICSDHRFLSGGSIAYGDWIDVEKGTWNPDAKPVVDGEVWWKEAFVNITTEGESRHIKSNNLPTDHPTGIFPIQKTDDAYKYDQNPSNIAAQKIDIKIPLNPQLATTTSCLNQGPIGFSLGGVAIFGPLDLEGRDALAYEIQDSCYSHPAYPDLYHFHNLAGSACIGTDDASNPTKQSKLLGYALDGFGIYSQYENGKELFSADLDECNGKTSEVEWNGKKQSIYHYVATRDFPYTISCYKGTPRKNMR